jgi:hypothetical protein
MGVQFASYTPSRPARNSVTGYCISRNGRTASQRAAIAARIIAGEVEFTKPTKKQIAELLHVSIVYVDRALELDPISRHMMADGLLQLTQFRKAPTDLQLNRTVQAAGVDRTLNAVEPLLG